MNINAIRRFWIVRVLRKWVWLLGFFPLVLDYLAAYVPSELLPLGLRSFLAEGGSWSITLVLLTIGLFLSAYFVNREDSHTIKSLESQLLRVNSLKPSVDIRLTFRDLEPSAIIRIPLKDNPPKPDFEKLVEAKRRELTNKGPTPDLRGSIYDSVSKIAQMATASAMQEPNPDFDEEVVEYLKAYREHLQISYDLQLDRAFTVAPFVVNEGIQSATSASLEHIMPKAYEKPREHQEIARSELDEDELLIYTAAPVEPKPYRSKLNILNSIPYISPMLDHAFYDTMTSDGPVYHLADGTWRITYDLGELVPQRPMRDLDPFWIWAGEVGVGDKWTIVARTYAKELSEPQVGYLTIEFVEDN